MKKAKYLLLFVLCMNSYFLSATNPIPFPNEDFSNYSVKQFLELKFATFKQVTGKSSLNDRIKFLGMKKFLRIQVENKKVNADSEYKTASDRFDFRWGAFLFGVFLSVFGIIFVLLIYDKPRKNAVISWLIGLLVGGVSFGISIG